AGTRLIESMIETLVGSTRGKAGAGNIESLDRGFILEQVAKVRDQYQDKIQANPWLREQLETGYWD
ncbi:hypothetical protein BGZ94_005536, partial [Podila epigama]